MRYELRRGRPAVRLFRRRAGDAQGDFDDIGNLVLELTGIDVEIAALDGEAGTDDQQITFLIRHALAKFVLQISQFYGHGDFL